MPAAAADSAPAASMQRSPDAAAARLSHLDTVAPWAVRVCSNSLAAHWTGAALATGSRGSSAIETLPAARPTPSEAAAPAPAMNCLRFMLASGELYLQHGVRVRRKAVPQTARFGSDGALHRLHGSLIEIVFGLDIGPVHLGDCHGTRELLVFGLELGFDALVAMPVDHIQHERTIVVGGRNIQIGHAVEPLRLVLRTIHEQFQRFAPG